MTIAYACDCMYMCVNFEGFFFFFKGGGGGGGGGGGECKTREKFNFSEKW